MKLCSFSVLYALCQDHFMHDMNGRVQFDCNTKLGYDICNFE